MFIKLLSIFIISYNPTVSQVYCLRTYLLRIGIHYINYIKIKTINSFSSIYNHMGKNGDSHHFRTYHQQYVLTLRL